MSRRNLAARDRRAACKYDSPSLLQLAAGQRHRSDKQDDGRGVRN
jgi:hypothetical protein